MNKWKASSKNNDACSCANSQGLCLSNRFISIALSGGLFLLCVTFTTGYFLGKKYSVEHYMQQTAQDLFVDTVYTSVASNAALEKSVSDGDMAEVVQDELLKVADELDVAKDTDLGKKYYAELIGFGTENAAQQFVKKLSCKGIDVEMKKRTSTTARGKKRFWYQVVTMMYEDKTEMQKIIDRIVKEEKLRDVYIRTC
jgi:hypothetical protein